MRNILIHWSMRSFRGATPTSTHETQEIYEVPFSGPYDKSYMEYLLKIKLIPKDIKIFNRYVCAVEIEELDKALTIQVRITIHHDKEVIYV